MNILSEEIVTGLEIVSIDLIFENCEIYTIPIANISFSIELSDIRNYNSYERYAEEVRLIVKNFDNITPYHSWTSKATFQERIIQYDDITSIRLKYNDDSEFNIITPWNIYEGEDNNTFQESTFDTYGCLVIDIRNNLK